jgi:AraC family transcriptional regulator
MEVHIKNMVCGRCIKVVKDVFDKAGAPVTDVQLGVVKLRDAVNATQENIIRKRLEEEGFEWLDEQKAKLVEQVKQLIVELVHYSDLDEMKENLSEYLSGKLHRDYHYLSNLFSLAENTTIEQYFILQKIERVKEWLVYDELTLSEMSFKLGYSSVAHLSGQFKKITGFTPSAFRKLKDHHRNPLDKLSATK